MNDKTKPPPTRPMIDSRRQVFGVDSSLSAFSGIGLPVVPLPTSSLKLDGDKPPQVEEIKPKTSVLERTVPSSTSLTKTTEKVVTSTAASTIEKFPRRTVTVLSPIPKVEVTETPPETNIGEKGPPKKSEVKHSTNKTSGGPAVWPAWFGQQSKPTDHKVVTGKPRPVDNPVEVIKETTKLPLPEEKPTGSLSSEVSPVSLDKPPKTKPDKEITTEVSGVLLKDKMEGMIEIASSHSVLEFNRLMEIAKTHALAEFDRVLNEQVDQFLKNEVTGKGGQKKKEIPEVEVTETTKHRHRSHVKFGIYEFDCSNDNLILFRVIVDSKTGYTPIQVVMDYFGIKESSAWQKFNNLRKSLGIGNPILYEMVTVKKGEIYFEYKS